MNPPCRGCHFKDEDKDLHPVCSICGAPRLYSNSLDPQFIWREKYYEKDLGIKRGKDWASGRKAKPKVICKTDGCEKQATPPLEYCHVCRQRKRREERRLGGIDGLV